jgi:hypothetical protein
MQQFFEDVAALISLATFVACLAIAYIIIN